MKALLARFPISYKLFAASAVFSAPIALLLVFLIARPASARAPAGSGPGSSYRSGESNASGRCTASRVTCACISG